MTRVQLLEHLQKAWRELEASYAGLAEPEMLAPGVAGAWSIRDIIAHVSTWEEESLKHLPAIARGEKPPRYSVAYGGIDAFNARMTEQKKGLSLTEVLIQRDAIHRKLVEYLHEVEKHQFMQETRFRRRLRWDTWNHYLKHAAAIRKWREQRS